jgi:NifU-like protein involved in Fe-S cluster formation
MFRGQDNEMQGIITDILVGLKGKFVQPVLDENGRLLNMLEELKRQDQESMAELKEQVALLEQKIEKIPLLVLSAIRDAINQASKEE